jgi:hypothetical protein
MLVRRALIDSLADLFPVLVAREFPIPKYSDPNVWSVKLALAKLLSPILQAWWCKISHFPNNRVISSALPGKSNQSELTDRLVLVLIFQDELHGSNCNIICRQIA